MWRWRSRVLSSRGLQGCGHRPVRFYDRHASARTQHRHAFFRKVAEAERRLLWRGFGSRHCRPRGGGDLRLAQHREPIRKLGPASIITARRFLVLAPFHSGWAFEANVEMVEVAPPGSHLAEPRPVLADLLTEHLLDGGMHEDAADLRVGRRALDQFGVQGSPYGWIDGEGIFQHRRGGDVLALLRSEDPVRHRREPDVGIEPDLVARVAGDHRTAARLSHVADEKARPAIERARV